MGRSQEVRIIILADGRPVALVLLGNSWVPQNVVEASANSLWQGGRRRVHSNSLHLGREVLIYAFCGTLAAKVILTS